MAKRYIVDLRSLNPVDREDAFKQIDKFAFMATMVMGSSGLEAVELIWDLKENFATSPALPAGCPWREI